jgi:hypothetical protein
MVVMFLYISIIFSLLIADFITNPLLYLKTNVRKSANTLEEILDGNSKITAEQLTFIDSIKTRDETKDLSKEIKNMVGIIRGIIPYISFSTLQAADKDTKKATSSRELCFLFTDIRGFTTLCEGKPPKDEVEILNHYLDIETEIILNNGGDIDKFVGDEMMAFFAGPKKEYNACKAAMEIRAAMRFQQEQYPEAADAFYHSGVWEDALYRLQETMRIYATQALDRNEFSMISDAWKRLREYHVELEDLDAQLYENANTLMEKAEYEQAADLFHLLPGYRDSEMLESWCRSRETQEGDDLP